MNISNLMTPDEAKKTWCPFSRVINVQALPTGIQLMPGGEVAFNRLALAGQDVSIPPPTGTHCLAEGCQLWAWHADRLVGACSQKIVPLA